MRQVLGRDARPLVGDRDDDGAVAWCGRQPDGCPRRREANRVGREVLQRLLEAIAIADHRIRAGLD